MTKSQLLMSANRNPTRKPGSDPGKMMRRIEREAIQPEGATCFNQLGVDATDGAEGVDVHREDTTERYEIDLGRFADAEPDDEEGKQPEDWNGPGRLKDRVEEILAQVEEA